MEFKLPIEYIEKKHEVNKNILVDLELYNNVDSSINLYNDVFKTKSKCEKENLNLWNKYYTTDKDFLLDSQNLYKNISNTEEYDLDLFDKDWQELKNETSFKEKYNYVDWELFEYINHSPFLLEFLSIYNLMSPVLALFFPILMLIFPFFIIKIQGIPITVNEYFATLKKLAGNHVIGKMLSNFNESSVEKKTYLITSVIFYFVQIYQNVLVCLRFYRNIFKIHTFLFKVRDYIKYSIKNSENLYNHTKDLKTYLEFNNKLLENKDKLIEINEYLEKINPFVLYDIKKVLDIGDVLCIFYELYYDDEYNAAINFSFNLNGYINNIKNINENISTNMALCKYKNKGKITFKDAYFAPLVNKNPIKNSYSLKDNKIITGPNASGKTTILKTTLLNILLSQQIGCGFYKNANIIPYDYIHCYLNIPDTSGRDSLFQAEVRRCKEILNIINENSTKRHFCIYDELYSGTNPYEAVASAYSFLKFIVKNKNINFMLTTHYIHLCEKFKEHKKIKNYNMHTDNENDIFKYNYKLQRGISKIKGGINVLIQFDYPKIIVNDAKKVLHSNF